MISYFSQFFITDSTTVSDSYTCSDGDNFTLGQNDERVFYSSMPPDKNYDNITVSYSYTVNGVTLSIDGNFLSITTSAMPHHQTPFYYNTTVDADSDGITRNDDLSDDQCTFSMGNSIQDAAETSKIPLRPEVQETPESTSLDTIGVAFDGVTLYNEYASNVTSWSVDADAFDMEADTFDKTLGHPQAEGQYHYHVDITYSGDSTSVTPVETDREKLLGFARDGFPIYGPQESGENIEDSDLDSCRGHVSTTSDFGEVYHYHVKPFEDIQENTEDSYIIGCYSGTKGTTE